MINQKNILTFFFCCCFLSCFTQDQQVNVQFFDTDEGLSGREIFSVQQDNRGLIWIATDNGLNSFDGLNFTIVKDSTFLLSSGEIKGIKKSEDGKFWINKENTPPILFNPETKIIESDFRDDKSTRRLEVVISDGNGPIVNFIDEIGQAYYLDKDQQILPYPKTKNPSLDYQIPTSWNTTFMWGKDSTQVEEFDKEGNIQRILPYDKKKLFFYDSIGNFLKVIAEQIDLGNKPQDDLFVLKETGLFEPIVLKKNHKVLTYDNLNCIEKGINYFRLTKDSQGNIWLVINDHLYFFDKNGNFKEDLTKRLAILGGNVKWNATHLFVDKNDRLWLSTGLGLFLIQLEENQFDYYLVENSQYSTRGITELSDNKLLIFTYKDAHVLDKTTKEILWIIKFHGLGLSHVSADTIYCGSEGRGLYRLVDSTKTLFVDPTYPIVQNPAIKIPFLDKKSNQLFLGAANGLYHLVNDSIQIYEKLNEFKELNEYQITSFHQNQEGIWIGSFNGIYLLDPQKGIVDHIQLPYQHVKHIHEDATGDFWIGTGGGGLIHWKRSKNIFRQLTTKDGLANNLIYAVYEDEAGYLWLPSNNGLMRFDKKNNEVVTFNTSDGIPHQEFNTYSHYQAKDGRLYFGGINGVIAFYPKELNYKENNAPFIVTALQKYDDQEGQLVDKSNQFLQHPKVELEPGDKFFTINFALLDYVEEPHSFAWRIKGLEEEWNYQRENSIRINSLPPGNYTLEIKAKGQGGNWAKNQLSVPVVVKQAFYKSWLFFLICSLLFLSILYFGHRIRLMNLTKRQAYLESEIAERTTEINQQNLLLKKLNSNKDQFFSIIGHDLRGPLLSLRGISKKVNFLIEQDRIKEVHQLGEKIEQSTEQVTKLLDNLLGWALVQKGQFPYHPETHNLSFIVQEMVEIYQSSSDIKNIRLNNLTNADHQVYADRNAISTVVRNLIDNALKFTDQGGEILIESIVEKEAIFLEISDTGTGISPTILPNIFEFSADRKKIVKGTGLGLVLCKDLIEMNKGDIQVESKLGVGTKFLIRIPRYLEKKS